MSGTTMMNQLTGNGLTLVPSLNVPVATNCAADDCDAGLMVIDCSIAVFAPQPLRMLQKARATADKLDLLIMTPNRTTLGHGQVLSRGKYILRLDRLLVNRQTLR